MEFGICSEHGNGSHKPEGCLPRVCYEYNVSESLLMRVYKLHELRTAT